MNIDNLFEDSEYSQDPEITSNGDPYNPDPYYPDPYA